MRPQRIQRFYGAFFLAALMRRMLSYLVIVYGFQSLGGGGWSGLLYFCVFAPYLLLGLYAGVIVDRSSKRRSLTLALAAAEGIFLAIAAAAADDWFGWAHQRGALLCAGTFLYGLDYALIYPCFLAALPQFVKREEIGKATITINVLSTVALAYAPLLVGVLRTRLEWGALFGTLAVGSAAAWLLAVRSGVAPGESTAGSVSDWESMQELLRFSRGQRRLAHVFVCAALFCLFMVGPLEVLLPNLLERGFGFAPFPAGLFIAIGGTGLVAGSALALAVVGRGRPEYWLSACAIVSSVLMVVSVHASRPVLGAILFLSGGFAGVFSSLVIAHVQSWAPDALRGRVMGLFALIMGGVPSLGGLGAGLVADRCGVGAAVEGAFGLAVVLFAVAAAAAPRLRSAAAA